MTVSIAQILAAYGQNIVGDIRSNLSRTGTNASGKTSQSISYIVSEEGNTVTLQVYGRPFIWVVETGRGPRRSTQNHGVVNNIRKWMDAKGVGSQLTEARKESLARFLTWRINKEGTALFKQGGREDIISNVVGPTLIGKIAGELMDNFATQFMDNVKQQWQ